MNKQYLIGLAFFSIIAAQASDFESNLQHIINSRDKASEQYQAQQK